MFIFPPFTLINFGVSRHIYGVSYDITLTNRLVRGWTYICRWVYLTLGGTLLLLSTVFQVVIRIFAASCFAQVVTVYLIHGPRGVDHGDRVGLGP